MRTILFTLTVLLICIVGMVSCTKEKSETAISVAAPTDEQLVSQVHWFMNAAKDVKEGKYFKSSEKIFLDIALVTISNTLNYVYCSGDASFRRLEIDTVLVNIPILPSEQKTYIVDALVGYNITVERIREKYISISGAEKKLVCCVIQNAGITPGNDSVVLRVISQVGVGTNPVTTTSSWDDEYRYWWTKNSWNCFDGSGYEGAPNKLEQNINFKFNPALPPNCRRSYSNTATIVFDDPKAFVGDGIIDNFCDYKIFYASSAVDTLNDTVKCLGIEFAHPGINEMEYYTNGIDSIISNWLFLNHFDFKTCTVDHAMGTEPFPAPPNTETIFHKVSLTYGHAYLDCNQSYPISIEW